MLSSMIDVMLAAGPQSSSPILAKPKPESTAIYEASTPDEAVLAMEAAGSSAAPALMSP